MELLVAYRDDPAGHNMAESLSRAMTRDGDIFRGEFYDLLEIPTPAISADWLEERYHYDGFVFLSKHAATSGILALTCHSTGNFSEAMYGGCDREVAVPHPHLQKRYLQTLSDRRSDFEEFQITIEATHHGPTGLGRPSIFIEIGTTPKQWNDRSLCDSVASMVHQTMSCPARDDPVAVCFGGSHYPSKFTRELLYGRHALGTVVPRHALDLLDLDLFEHIMRRNGTARAALLDWNGMGKNRQKVLGFLESTDLEVIRL